MIITQVTSAQGPSDAMDKSISGSPNGVSELSLAKSARNFIHTNERLRRSGAVIRISGTHFVT
jgi:hypothetical protein